MLTCRSFFLFSASFAEPGSIVVEVLDHVEREDDVGARWAERDRLRASGDDRDRRQRPIRRHFHRSPVHTGGNG